MIRTWYIIYKNFGGKFIAFVDAINEAEAIKILGQAEVVMDIDRIEDMHNIIDAAAREEMINSFNIAKTNQPK